MRIGYSFWGFLSDYRIRDGKEISSPDGNAFYSWVIIHELLKQGHKVYRMMPDRDRESFEIYGRNAFRSFSTDKRVRAYSNSEKAPNEYPELDLLFLEWRFPTHRNTQKDGDPDLRVQDELLSHYSGTPKVVFDLDYKLTEEDERKWDFDLVLETALDKKQQYSPRRIAWIPSYKEDLFQFSMKDAVDKISYVGSRYERDDVIDRYIKRFAEVHPGIVQFYGNWRDYPEQYSEALQRWPGIIYNNRIAMRDFRQAYEDSIVCPLLGKAEYLKRGFVTARVLEALMFGTIPVGLNEHFGINAWTPFCISESMDLERYLYDEQFKTESFRNDLRKKLVEQIYRLIDPARFVRTLLGAGL